MGACKGRVLAIPVTALLTSEDGGYYVYTLNDNKAVKTQIETGIQNDEYIEVLSGIKKGDVIVTDGKDYISENNNTVNIVKK